MTVQVIDVNRDLGAERRVAAETFRRSLTARGTFAVRLISSPGRRLNDCRAITPSGFL
jgi:hypothetical protein